MTDVRQAGESRKGGKKAARKTTAATRAAKAATPKRSASRQPSASTASTASQVAQVRLQADELAALHQAMRTLHLPSRSEALREGIRLLTREAAETAAAEDIRGFYGTRPAPLPDGVVPAAEEELAAADAERW